MEQREGVIERPFARHLEEIAGDAVRNRML